MKWYRKLSLSLAAVAMLFSAAALPTTAQQKKPNIVIIWGDDIGQTDVSAYSMGLMGFRTPNIDRVAREGMTFTDYYAEQSCHKAMPQGSSVRITWVTATNMETSTT
jgi:hypothetical protein